MATHNPFDFFIQWHLTEQCNLRCSHCYQDESTSPGMSFSAIQKTAAEASDMIKEWSGRYRISFQKSMNITGGEPFLRPDLFDILEEIKSRDFAVHLLTNATLIDTVRARRLSDIGVDGVQVSMEGPENVHDMIRGPGSFKAAAEGVEKLVDAGLAVTLNVTISALNADHLRTVIARGSDLGVKRIGFSRLVPSGRGRVLIANMLNRAELKKLYSSVLFLESENVAIVTGDPVAAQMKNPATGDAGNIAVSGCAAGLSGLTIHPDGVVTPCRRLGIPIGTVLKDSLRGLWCTSPVLQKLRNRSGYRGRCGACERWAVCRGCRAIAYAVSRARGQDDLLADDPQCFHNREESMEP